MQQLPMVTAKSVPYLRSGSLLLHVQWARLAKPKNMLLFEGNTTNSQKIHHVVVAFEGIGNHRNGFTKHQNSNPSRSPWLTQPRFRHFSWKEGRDARRSCLGIPVQRQVFIDVIEKAGSGECFGFVICLRACHVRD